MEEVRSKGGPRVISTDKLDKPTVTAIEVAPPARPEVETGGSAVANTATASPSASAR